MGGSLTMMLLSSATKHRELGHNFPLNSILIFFNVHRLDKTYDTGSTTPTVSFVPSDHSLA
jgi:hypothetical protein